MQQDIVKRFFSGTSTSYDRIVNLFTYGADRYWKKKILANVPQSRRILDLGCGTGILTLKLAKRCPCGKIVGVDMMHDYLVEARKKSSANSCAEVDFICARAEQVQLREEFDCITSSYIPKYVSADDLLRNISPTLKPGGVLVLHDFAYPDKLIFKSLWHLHMFLIKAVGTPIFPEWKTVFRELADFVKSSRWIPEYVQALPTYGFVEISVERYTAGTAAVICATKR